MFFHLRFAIISVLAGFALIALPAIAGPECDSGTKEDAGCDCFCLGGAVPPGTEEGAEVTVGGVSGTNSFGRLQYRRDNTCNSAALCEQECDRLLPSGDRGGTDSNCVGARADTTPESGASGGLSCQCSCTIEAGGSTQTPPPSPFTAPSEATAPVLCENLCRGAALRTGNRYISASASCGSGPLRSTSQQGPAKIEITNPLGTTSIPALIGRIISALLGISGSIAIVMVVYGGFTWLTSGGSPEKIEKGKQILVWAVAGLALIFGAYSLVNFVLSRIIGI